LLANRAKPLLHNHIDIDIVIASKLAPTKSVGVGDHETSKSAATPVGASLLANRAKPIIRDHIDTVIASKLL
jgi:hypothetical protein